MDASVLIFLIIVGAFIFFLNFRKKPEKTNDLQRAQNEEILPEEILCPDCGADLKLSQQERIEWKFKCHACKETFVVKPDDANNNFTTEKISRPKKSKLNERSFKFLFYAIFSFFAFLTCAMGSIEALHYHFRRMRWVIDNPQLGGTFFLILGFLCLYLFLKERRRKLSR
jgi:DNA-directed RNA polymerase subunit M/transcription elongation factor TFIIS